MKLLLPFLMKLVMWYMDFTGATKKKKRRVLKWMKHKESDYNVSVNMRDEWHSIEAEMAAWESKQRAGADKKTNS